jgi:MiaB/RimO family radical SAM methylthiotransferase
LTSQDLASYGLDKEGNILSLLRKIDTLKGDFWVRLGMSNPQHLMPISEELPRLILKSKHFFRFLHIPLQSGSNRILRIMGRKYTREEYLKLIKRIRAIIPDFTLSTDIITGFPGEEQGNFKETLDVIKQIQPDILNISRYWARPNTMAAKMKQLKPEIAIERAKEARKAFNNLVLKKNKGWIGWQGKAIIDEKGRKESLKGRNLWYKQLIFAKKEVEKHHLKIGERVRIKVVRGSNFNLFSKVIQKKS